jgi:serine/threonine-protein kinase RsbW
MAYIDSDNETAFQVQVVQNDLRSVIPPKEAVLAELERHGYPDCDVFAIKLALEEALTNAVKHGNANDPGKQVTVRYCITSEKAIVIVRDEGSGFYPEEVPDCTCAERLPVPNGRGIMLMKAYMDKICYRDKGREVYFMKRRSCHDASAASPDSTEGNVRRTIHFSGKVQGVGFRFNAESVASRYTVTGYVRNLHDGRVELVAEGDETELDRFQKAIEQSMNGHIEHIDAKDSAPTGEFLSFRITR